MAVGDTEVGLAQAGLVNARWRRHLTFERCRGRIVRIWGLL